MKLKRFILYGFSSVLCLSVCPTAKFPKSICSSYCENNELVCVMQELSYMCQMALYTEAGLRVAFTRCSGAHHVCSLRHQGSRICEQLLLSHKRIKREVDV